MSGLAFSGTPAHVEAIETGPNCRRVPGFMFPEENR
jgi:hypothetical protein